MKCCFVPNGNLPCPAPVTFIMADVKKFKLINDTFGHLAGDECLKKIAEILADTFKKEDIIIRYGGDEFLVIQWSNNIEQTALFINNVRQRIRSLRFSGYPGLCLDVNMGYAISAAPIQSKDDCTALLNAADTHMYREKAP